MPGTRPAFLSERWPSETFAMENATGYRSPPPSLRSAVLGQDSPSPSTPRVPVGEGGALGFSVFLQVCTREDQAMP